MELTSPGGDQTANVTHHDVGANTSGSRRIGQQVRCDLGIGHSSEGESTRCDEECGSVSDGTLSGCKEHDVASLTIARRGQ